MISTGHAELMSPEIVACLAGAHDRKGAVTHHCGRPAARRSALTRCGAWLAAAATVAGASACTTRSTPSPSPSTTGFSATHKLRIAYLQKQADQQYFLDEASGARAEAAKLGNVEVTVVNLGNDATTALREFDAAIASHVDGIALVVPDQQIGPQVIQQAMAANIPLLASDDGIKDAAGNPAPFVGFDSALMGQKVGEQAGRLFKAAGWDVADTRIITAWKQDLSGCTERVDGAHSAFMDATGVDIPDIEIGTDNTPVDAERKSRLAYAAHTSVKHWVVWGCNDENETGIVSALQDSGVNPANIIGVGLGAYMTCRDWRSGAITGNRAALYIDGKDVGASAIDALVEKVREGKDLPPKTIAKSVIVDRESWQSAGVACT